MTRRGRPPHADQLTPAEWRVVEAVRQGMTSRQIAERRGISIDAVKYHVANALMKLELPDRAALRQWNGIARGTALSRQETKMDQDISLGAIGQVARRVKDIAQARLWYGQTLGLPHLYSFGDQAFFDMGGTRLFLSQDESAEQPESILYFRVPDIRAAHQSLAARGVAFINAPHLIHRHDDGTEEWMAFFQDPEGRPLGLMSQVKP